MCRELNARFPGRIAMMMSQSSWRHPKHIPFVLDNDRFSVWSKGKKWSKSEYKEFLHFVKGRELHPEWPPIPDVVADPIKTIQWYEKWAPWIEEEFHFPLAVVVQDGMLPKDVHDLRFRPEVVFVGGATEWK